MIEKHSLNLQGHQTSVSLEPEFWQAFRECAKERNMSLQALAIEIDANREGDTNLASAIRLYVLENLRARLEVEMNS